MKSTPRLRAAALAETKANGKNGTHRNGNGSLARFVKMFGPQWDSYLAGLASVDLPAAQRARDPFQNHPWIFAAAMTTAIVASQAPLKIYRETGDALDRRQRQAKALGRPWVGPKAGRARRAFQRHLELSVSRRFLWKARGIEEDLEHPLMDVLLRPNPYQDGGQLQQFTDLVYALRHEVFWVLTAEDGRLIRFGEQPAQIWPYGPDYFAPRYSRGSHGRLIGWDFRPPTWSPMAGAGHGLKIPLELFQVIQFKGPNPSNILRAVAPTAPLGMAIETDLAIQAQHRALLKKGAVPRGVMKWVGEGGPTEEELGSKKEQFEEEHVGETRAGETLFLPPGWEYQAIGLAPKDMQDLQLLGENKDAELAVMGMPKSVLGVVDFKTYATQLGQDKNLWDKRIIPMKRGQERTLDGTLLYPETDSTFAGFDYRSVEALRAGLEHKALVAQTLASDKLHMPPRMAFELVDLEVEDYPGIDAAFVPPTMVTAEDVVSGAALEALTPPPAEEKPSEDLDEPGDPDQPKPGTPADGNEPDTEAEKARKAALQGALARLLGSTKAPAGIVRVSSGERVERARNRWAAFLKAEMSVEKQLRVAYRGWVGEAKRDVLRRFDAATGKKADDIDLTAILPDPDEWKKKLQAKSRPAHFQALEATWNLTVEEIGGVPIFDIDDDRIIDHFERREKRFVGTTTEGLIKRIRKTLETGQASGETIQELRARLSQTMGVAEGSPKTLQVARTEAGGFMNGVRDEMFGLQGFEKMEWSTAGDEHVRDDHVTFGNAGAQPRGFDYLSLVGGGGGRLRHPGDMEAPAKQVVNCRCLSAPSDEGEKLRGVDLALISSMKKISTAVEGLVEKASAPAPAPPAPPIEKAKPVEVHVHQEIRKTEASDRKVLRVEKQVARKADGTIEKVIETPIYAEPEPIEPPQPITVHVHQGDKPEGSPA